ncbi:MAG: cupin domain-containing protein [Bdellovibrionia bacterium]
MKLSTRVLTIALLFHLAFTPPHASAGYRPASRPSSKQEAQEALLDAGYTFQEADLTRKGKTQSGAGFWDAITHHQGVPSRIIRFGRGEYLGPHTHDIDETFHVSSGSGLFWLSTNQGKTWHIRVFSSGDEISVPAGTIHRLVASDQEGLTLHILMDDRSRGTHWNVEFNFDYETQDHLHLDENASEGSAD